jgi:hypothetical protein
MFAAVFVHGANHLLAMVVNDNAECLMPRCVCWFFASRLAPTGRARFICNRRHKKAARKRLFGVRVGLLQTGHLFDRAFELVIGAIGASAFRRHRVDTGNGFGQDAV